MFEHGTLARFSNTVAKAKLLEKAAKVCIIATPERNCHATVLGGAVTRLFPDGTVTQLLWGEIYIHDHSKSVHNNYKIVLVRI